MATIDEYRRFVSSEYQGVVEWRTVEIYSPATSVLRYVIDVAPQEFTLEFGAPRDASEKVTFAPIGGKLTEPMSSDEGDRAITLEFGGASLELNNILKRLTGTARMQPIEFIYRKYCSLNLSQPAMTPFYYEIVGVNFRGINSVTVVAEDAELNVKKPGRYYLLNNFEGLKNK